MKEILTAYGLQLIVGLIALFALWKDWKEYRKRSKKWGRPIQVILAFAAVLFIVLSLLDTHYNRANTSAEQKFLTNQIQQLRDDAKVANDGFRESFAGLYDKFSQLQAKVQTDALLRQNASLIKDIDETKKQLSETQAKLVQPKAAPVASFQTDDEKQIPITETTVARTDPVSVPIIVYNPSDVPAVNGAVNIQICAACTFASEPVGFAKLAGAPEMQRSMDFQHIYSHSGMPLLTVVVKVPMTISRFVIAVHVNCETCVPAKSQELWVTLK